MASSISGEQFGEAILAAVENGAYPENEDIIAAELPSSAFPALLSRLQASRREIEVILYFTLCLYVRLAVQSDVHYLSRKKSRS